MIRKTVVLLGAIGLIACQPPAEGELGQLKAQLDSLNAAGAAIAQQTKAIEEAIAELDTTRVKRVVLVTTKDVQQQKFEHFFQVHGNVEVENLATIAPEAAGEVVKINVSEGAKVSKGQVLVQLDDAAVRKQLAGVQTQLDLAEKMLERQQTLWKDKIGSQAQLDQTQAQVDGLKQQKAAILEQLDMFSIQAPFSGVVDEIFVKVGENLNPMSGMPAVRVINLDDVYVKADVSEQYLGAVKEGGDVIVSFDGMDLKISAPIKRVGSFINPNNRTFKIRLEMENPGNRLKPNLLAKLKVKDFEQDSALVLPASLIQQDPEGKDFVYVIGSDDNGSSVARRKMLETGLTYEGMTQILGGITLDDKILDKGSRSVTDGVSIKISE